MIFLLYQNATQKTDEGDGNDAVQSVVVDDTAVPVMHIAVVLFQVMLEAPEQIGAANLRINAFFTGEEGFILGVGRSNLICLCDLSRAFPVPIFLLEPRIATRATAQVTQNSKSSQTMGSQVPAKLMVLSLRVFVTP